jgi:uncharacterized membrane protein
LRILDNRRVAKRALPRRITLPVVLGITVLTLGLGVIQKAPCFGPWDGRQYTLLCYSDIVPLFHARGLDSGLIPYLEAENEYPVLTGFTMALAGIPAGSSNGFFAWNAVILGGLALGTAWALYRMVGSRALYFALAPTLLIYAFVNWDLLAVALATLGIWGYLRRRDGLAGLALGLGAAAKLYPALLIIPLALGRVRERRPVQVLLLGWAATAAWAAVHLPVALAAPERVAEFFRFSAERPADWDSVWHLIQRHLDWPRTTEMVNLVAGVSFVTVAVLLWMTASRVRPGFPAWTFGFPLLVAFLLTNKVYSPQFSLWLLPWFALVFPYLRLFLAFSAAEIAVFVTRFQFFAWLEGLGGVPFGAFEAALVVRAAVLIACLVWWVRLPAPAPIGERGG